MAGTNFNEYFTLKNVEDGILSDKVFACYVRNILMNKPCDKPCEHCKAECIDWLKDEFKPKLELTEFEKDVLKKAYDDDYEYIARDEDGALYLYGFFSNTRKESLEFIRFWLYKSLIHGFIISIYHLGITNSVQD